MSGALRPWAQVDPALAAYLRPVLPEVVEEIVRAIAREVPAYTRPLEGAFGQGVRRGVEVALDRLLALLGEPQEALGNAARVYLDLGAGELRAGRPLEDLLAAYRVGARVTWQSLARSAQRAGAGSTTLIRFAEALFVYIDELSAASAAGYARAQSEEAGERDRLRAELARLVLAGAGTAEPARAVAASVAWVLPEQVRVIAFRRDPQPRPAGAVLLAEEPVGVLAVWPVLPGAPAPPAAGRPYPGGACVVSDPVALPEAAAAARCVRRARDLQERGLLPGDDPLLTGEHRAALVLHADPDALAELARVRLAPLAGVDPVRRERLTRTLSAWLAYRGDRGRIGTALHVHPQTVSYRVAALRELFGADLDDPAVRFELSCALFAPYPGSAGGGASGSGGR